MTTTTVAIATRVTGARGRVRLLVVRKKALHTSSTMSNNDEIITGLSAHYVWEGRTMNYKSRLR